MNFRDNSNIEYRKLDAPLKFINKNYITIGDKDREKYSKILADILEAFRRKMAESDEVYKTFEGAVHYTGSAYDKVKVGKPDEFDLNIVMKLPAAWNYQDDIKVKNSSPSYVTINVKSGCERSYRDPSFLNKYQKGIKIWTDSDGYFIQEQFHAWMEGVVKKALNRFPSHGLEYIIQTNGHAIYVKTKKSGPALTLQCESQDRRLKIDVDLVPVIQFNNNSSTLWLSPPVRQKPLHCLKKTWCAVPKPKKNGITNKNREWRVSFTDQEKDLLYNKGRIKNLIRQIKKLKSVHDETKSLPSYYVKTIFLWALDDKNLDQNMWTQWSDGALFMFMLKKLYSHLDENRIPYYWDSRCNLLDALGYAVNNMKYKIQRIIKDIENSLDNPEVLAKYLLTADEFADFRRRYGSIEEGFESLSIDSAPPVSDLRGDSRCCIL